MNILHRHPPLFTHDAHQRLRDLEAIIFAILKRTGPITIRNEELVALPVFGVSRAPFRRVSTLAGDGCHPLSPIDEV